MPVTVSGLAELTSGFDRLGSALRDWTGVNQRAAALMAAAASTRAPRRTGRLAASMRPEATVTTAGATSSLTYAAVVHFGWPRRGIRAQPFVSQAISATETQWLNLYATHLQALCDNAF